ncbi:unnamed protein product [Eruca vesicaria subsp. sativa]|uniref:Uncharacterized protein n=1 Tax=Eruca vesicaria subsp. sativa TaxID=29727 RepID=A0ABC8LBP5_ERUVS|nr:unnamed protein product [Eruca vesicaria subsp. sativa]
MEESSDRLVRLGQDATPEILPTGYREITTVDDLAIQSTTQDLAAAGGLYNHVNHSWLYRQIRTLDQIRERSTTTEPYFFFFVKRKPYFFIPRDEKELKEESQQRPRPALPKARPRRDPPPRVSRRSSQVSQPIYLRHRFQPRSRNDDSSSRRQR